MEVGSGGGAGLGHDSGVLHLFGDEGLASRSALEVLAGSQAVVWFLGAVVAREETVLWTGLVLEHLLEVLGLILVVDFDEGGDGDFEDLVGVGWESWDSTTATTVAYLTIATFHLEIMTDFV